jgi:type IV pilus assembly protein PilA
MKKFLKRLWQNERGFTLIELIIVIAILAIIAAVAIPNILNAVDNSRRTTDVTNARMIADAISVVRAMNEDYSTATDVITFTGGAATAATDQDFADDVVEQLNNTVPEPRFTAATANNPADRFIATIAADGTISIEAGNGTATDNVDIFPTPDGVYDNQ